MARTEGETLARALRRRRFALGLTQRECGDLIGVGQTTYARWEQGNGLPAAKHVPAVTVFLQQEPDDVFMMLLPDEET